MGTLRLDHVDWQAALAAARSSGARTVSVASLQSLSALYLDDFTAAQGNVRAAKHAEPLNPLHELRMALIFARFGDLRETNRVLDRLKEKLPGTAVVDYLRALSSLRGGTLDKARAVASGVEEAHPSMVQAKFLRAEVQVVTAKVSTIEKYFVSLPVGREWEPLWADLMVKVVLLHPSDGPGLVQRYLDKKLGKDTPARALVERALAWMRANSEELAKLLADEVPGSRVEELLAECLIEKLEDGNSEQVLKSLIGLGYRHSNRPTLHRIYDTFLARRAMELTARGDYEAALPLVEESLRRHPYDPVYHQNRAALFTLLREPSPYQEAWATLNRHQYRLLLLGIGDPLLLTQIIKTHRLFTQQAHGQYSPSESLQEGHIFRFVLSESEATPRVAVNQVEIDADPELLRQWIHHQSAVLLFQHVQLGGNGAQVLLRPSTRDEASERSDSLTVLGESLHILVAEEGAEVAALLEKRWKQLVAGVPVIYVSNNENAAGQMEEEHEKVDEKTPVRAAIRSEEALLEEEHLRTLAELCLLCLQWSPAFSQIELAEELLRFTAAETTFFDERLLRKIESASGYETPWALQVLTRRVRFTAGEATRTLTPEQRRQTVQGCMAELLRTMAWSVHNGHAGTMKEAVVRAMSYVDRARALSSSDPQVELTAAHLLARGEFFDEARIALEKFHSLADPDDERGRETAGKLSELLLERRKEGKASERRERNREGGGLEGRASRIAELQEELDRSPGAWKLYEELVKELAAAAQFDEAVKWADRAVAHCLGRVEQMNVRGLSILARGIQKVSGESVQAARLLAVGAHDPARKVLEQKIESQQLHYTEHYALGTCYLASGDPESAQTNFRKAAELCTRPLHRTALRNLAENIDAAYISVARASLNEAISDGELDEAVETATTVFARLKEPAAWLLEFSRVWYSVALHRMGKPSPIPKPATVLATTPWSAAFEKAMASSSDAERALALALLSGAVYPESARQSTLIVSKAKELQRRIAAMETLNQAGTLLSQKKFTEVLTLIDAKDESIRGEPRLLRLRALALLGLLRFEEADETAEQLLHNGRAEMAEFAAQYPALAFRKRLATAIEYLRDGKRAEAEAILQGAVPVDDNGVDDLGYCSAFIAALEGFELSKQGNRTAAQQRFMKAMELISPQLHRSVSGDSRHVSELYDRIEREVDPYACR